MTPFKCEACGIEGEIEDGGFIGVGDSVSCPNCGSRYIAWIPPKLCGGDGKTVELKCVVKRVVADIFSEEPDN